MPFTIREFVIACLAVALVLLGHAPLASESTPAGQDSWNLFSAEQERLLSRQITTWLDGSMPVVAHGRASELLEPFESRLKQAASDSPFALSLKLVAEREPYLFAVPGGAIYLTSGWLQGMEHPAQLSAALLHQAAHVALRHTTRSISQRYRFSVRAAFVAAGTGRKSLKTTLGEIGVDFSPGSPDMKYSQEDEFEASMLAAEWLGRLERTPPALSGRQWRRLKELAAAEVSQSSDSRLASLMTWAAPPPRRAAAASREVFIARSYRFSYPGTWTSRRPGREERIEVAPKGGTVPIGVQDRIVAVGLMAGALAVDGQPAPAIDLLLSRIGEIRGPLVPAADQRGIPPAARSLDSMLLYGQSPATGRPEYAWAVAGRLQDRLFYMLMIAPEDEFDDFRAEFEAIFQSIEFKGTPLSNHAGASERTGTPASP